MNSQNSLKLKIFKFFGTIACWYFEIALVNFSFDFWEKKKIG